MAGKIVKTKQGKQGKTKNEDQLIYVEVMDNSIPHMERVRQVPKVQVYFDDGTKMLCDPKNLQFIGHWD